MKTKKRLIKEALAAYPSYTDSQIAKQVKCHPSYVHYVRKELTAARDEAAEITGELAWRMSQGRNKPKPKPKPGEFIECKAHPITLDELKRDVVAKYEGRLAQYAELDDVLSAAYDQAAYGKGAERHANDDPWTEQPIFKIASQAGDGFNVGQVIKKVQEAQQMAARGENDKARHEVLGAIVYAASLYVIWGKKGE